MGFDDHRPPRRDLLADCVHCGFCLPSCPTYLLWGEEADSPRGRIHLIGQALDGAPLQGAVATHLDRCLACMGCVTACPSGVHYDELIEAARAQVERSVPRPLRERLLRSAVFALFPHPRRLRAARQVLLATERLGLRRLLRRAAVAPRLPGILRTLDRLAPTVGPLESLPGHLVPAGPARGRIGLLTGCVQSVFFSEVNSATARVLVAEGFEVVVPPDQGCCGALAGHAGREQAAIEAAKGIIDRFEAAGVDLVAVNAAGCGSTIKAYGRLLADDPVYAERAARLAAATRDLSELLVEAGPRARRHRLEATVAYHDACHLSHAQQIRDQPRALLAQIPGLEVREVRNGEVCCGSAGVYNLLQPEAAAALGEAKAANVLETGAAVLVTSNPGCLLQITAAAKESGAALEGLHLAQVLDASLRDAPLAGLTRRADQRRRRGTAGEPPGSPGPA